MYFYSDYGLLPLSSVCFATSIFCWFWLSRSFPYPFPCSSSFLLAYYSLLRSGSSITLLYLPSFLSCFRFRLFLPSCPYSYNSLLLPTPGLFLFLAASSRLLHPPLPSLLTWPSPVPSVCCSCLGFVSLGLQVLYGGCWIRISKENRGQIQYTVKTKLRTDLTHTHTAYGTAFNINTTV